MLLFKLLLFCFFYIHFVNTYTFSRYEIRDLEETTDYIAQEALPWVVTNGLTTPVTTSCSGIRLLGGYGVVGSSTVFTRQYTLVPHALINFSIKFYLLDILGLETLLKIYFDSQLVGSWSAPTLTILGLTNVCGGGLTDYPNVKIAGQVSHSSPSLTVKVVSNSNGAASFGFREVNLLLSNTSGSTQACQFSLPLLGQASCLCADSQYGTSGLLTTCTSCASNCESCTGGSSTDCTSCPDGGSYNGNKCYTCNPSCKQCSGTAATDCLSCYAGKSLYSDGSCRSGCAAPLVTRIEGDKSFCDLPCLASAFFFWNNTCSSTCPSPLVSGNIAGVKTCSLPCSIGSFFYPDGSCQSSCNWPFAFFSQGAFSIQMDHVNLAVIFISGITLALLLVLLLLFLEILEA